MCECCVVDKAHGLMHKLLYHLLLSTGLVCLSVMEVGNIMMTFFIGNGWYWEPSCSIILTSFGLHPKQDRLL